jgi:hypothetical protein
MGITIQPNAELLADASIPRATLAGIDWPMPKMSLEQLYTAVPILVGSKVEITPARMVDLGSVVFMTLQRGHERLTRPEFNQWPVTFAELLEAVRIISTQTGMLKPSKSANGVTEAAIPLVASPTISAV